MHYHAWFICWDGISLTFCQGRPQTSDPPDLHLLSSFIGVSHCAQLLTHKIWKIKTKTNCKLLIKDVDFTINSHYWGKYIQMINLNNVKNLLGQLHTSTSLLFTVMHFTFQLFIVPLLSAILFRGLLYTQDVKHVPYVIWSIWLSFGSNRA
jgi:hypothetical protein